MGTGIKAGSSVGTLSVVALVGGGAPAQPNSPNTLAESAQSTATVPNHALSGVVKSVDIHPVCRLE